MCGIAGAYDFRGRRLPDGLLARMGQAMRHRGPDGSGQLVEEHVGLVHRRLAILDLTEAAHQPMRLPDGSGALCYNGELYNFRQLRAELEAEGVGFASTGDTEVVLQACRVWGVRTAVERFNGMFAFAYWDGKRRELWLARDRMGIKPLYYLRDGERVLFGSEMKTILSVASRDPAPDRNSLLQILTGGTTWEPYTLFEGLRALQPGRLMRLSADSSQTVQEPYFTVFDQVDEERYRAYSAASFAEMSARFEELMRESVRIHSVSDAPVGTLASGGVDSSLISVLTREHCDPLPLYHAEVVGEQSEARFASRVADHLGCELRVAPMRPEHFVEELVTTAWYHETPSAYHANDVPFQLVSRLAASDGIKVLLTGEGADELFIGYGEACKSILRNRAAGAVAAAGEALRPIAQLFFASRDEQMVEAFASRGVQGQWVRRANEAFEFISDPVEREALVSNVVYLKAHLNSLLQRNDRMGMMHGLESRIPFLENEMVSFAVNLPLRHKHPSSLWQFMQGHPLRRNKAVVRAAAARLLPASIVKRKKLGFPVSPDSYLALCTGLLRDGFLQQALAMRHSELSNLFTHASSEARWNMFSSELFGRLFFMGESIAGLSNALEPLLLRKAA